MNTLREDIRYCRRVFYPVLAANVAINTYCSIKDSNNYKNNDNINHETLIKDFKKNNNYPECTASKAYFEGAQMVQDSLKRRNLNGI